MELPRAFKSKFKKFFSRAEREVDRFDSQTEKLLPSDWFRRIAGFYLLVFNFLALALIVYFTSQSPGIVSDIFELRQPEISLANYCPSFCSPTREEGGCCLSDEDCDKNLTCWFCRQDSSFGICVSAKP